MNDPYASEADTKALLQRDTRTPAEKKLDQMLDERWANEQGVDAVGILRQIAIELIAPQAEAVPSSDLSPDEGDPVTLWAEIWRLREAVKGPDGYATWQDAATAERIRRVRAESKQAEEAKAVPTHDDTDLIKQMLEALRSCSGVSHWPALIPTINAARKRLETPQQAEAAPLLTDDEIDSVWDAIPQTQFWWRRYARAVEQVVRAKQAPPIPAEQIQKLRHLIDWTDSESYLTFARAIEAAHGIVGKEGA